MNKKVVLLSTLLAAGLGFSAQVKDVAFACGKKSCDITFKFSSDKNLPGFFQKYNAATGKWTIAFAQSSFALGEGSFVIDPSASGLKDVRVFKESGKQGELLKFEWTTGNSVDSDENAFVLKGSEFKVSLPVSKDKSWKLSSIAASQKKQAEVAALAAAKEEKLAKLDAEKEAKLRAAEEKKAALESAKAEKARKDSLAKAEKLAKINAEKEAKLRAAEEKKAALAAAKAEKARKDSLAKAEKLAKINAEKEAKLRAAEEKKAALAAAKEEKARRDSVIKAMKAVSALIDGVSEMTSVVGFGVDQFELKMLSPISLSNVVYSEKKNTVTIAVLGPEKSPVLKVNAGSFVKSLTWTKEGLTLQLSAGVRPVLQNRGGALLLQARESVATEGFLYWKALPTGIYTRRWAKPTEEVLPASFDEFANRYEKNSQKPVSAAQAFFLTALARELIVTADEIELYEGPNENSTALARLTFGEKLESIATVGLFHKVQSGPRIGYVDKRAVSFRDELSAVQSERLKQLAAEKGEAVESKPISFDSDDRVMYSSFGRRDPFVDVKGLVEEGINIDQVELVGIIWESDQPMAILSDVKNSANSYTIKEGDKVLNGKVLKITQTDVLFLIQEFGVSRRYSMGLPDKFGGKK